MKHVIIEHQQNYSLLKCLYLFNVMTMLSKIVRSFNLFNNVSFSLTNFFRRYMFKVCRHITIFSRFTKIPEVDRFLLPRLQQKNFVSRDSPKSPGSTDFCSTRRSPQLQQKKKLPVEGKYFSLVILG